MAGTHVPDDVYERVREHFDEDELVSLTFALVAINLWNPLNSATSRTTGVAAASKCHMTLPAPMRRPARLLAAILIVVAASAQRSGTSVETEQILDGLNLREGATVCEIGAGNGALSIVAAQRVGPDGLVYTSELGESRVKGLQENVDASGLKQIRVVSGHPSRTNFPESVCDALFMRNVYHHFADPAAMDASIFASVRAGGRVAVADFTPEGAEAARPADRSKTGSTHGVSPESVSRELRAAGFEAVSVWHDPSTANSSGEQWFIVFLAKPRP